MEVKFWVGKECVVCPEELLEANAGRFRGSIDRSTGNCRLPPWVTADALRYVLRFWETGILEHTDILSAHRILWVTTLFSSTELQFKLIETVIEPQINPSNVLLFLENAYLNELTSNWRVLYAKCMEIAEKYADFLYRHYEKGMKRLPNELKELIIRGYFRLKDRNECIDHKNVLLESLLEASNEENYLNLLSKERKLLLDTALEVVQTLDVPIVADAETTYTSEVFALAGLQWAISAVVSAVAGTVQVLLQYIGPADGLQHGLEALVISAEIAGKRKSNPEIVISTGKKTVRNWMLVEIDIEEKDEDCTLCLRFSSAYSCLYSALLTHVAHNASSLLSLPLPLLTPTDLSALLQYRFFTVPSEDFVLLILSKWCSEAIQPHQIDSFFPLFSPHIRWNFITFHGILTVSMRFRNLQKSVLWVNRVKNEIEQRALGLRLNSEIPFKQPGKPRKSYKGQIRPVNYGQIEEMMREVSETVCGLEGVRRGKQGKVGEFVGKMGEMERERRELEGIWKEKR